MVNKISLNNLFNVNLSSHLSTNFLNLSVMKDTSKRTTHSLILQVKQFLMILTFAYLSGNLSSNVYTYV